MRKYLCISNYCCIFASGKETNNKLNPKTRNGTEIMKTIIVEKTRRGEFSKLVNYAKTLSFHADKITFADFAPSANPKNDGWHDQTEYYNRVLYTNEDGSLKSNCSFDRVKELQFLPCKEIWYRLSTVGGAHRIYVKYHKVRFYLISHAYAGEGWQYFGEAFHKEDLIKKANELWNGNDLESETYLKNHRIVGESVAKRKYHVSFEMI